MKLSLYEHPICQFTYDSKTKTLIGEASDMLDSHLERLYDDSCDVGFAVRNPNTRNVVVFVLIKVNEDKEGEIQSWEYIISNDSVRNHPACSGMRAVIFND